MKMMSECGRKNTSRGGALAKTLLSLAHSLILSLSPFLTSPAFARSVVYNENVKTLQVTVNDDWQSLPVMQLGSDDVLTVAFDELSHTYHRYVCRLEHCEADWSPSEDIFDAYWLEGFNDNPIDDYENSLNTTVLYTHYRYQLPNDHCRLKMSGNYRLHILDADKDEADEVLCAEFRVVEPLANVGLSVTTNTDAGLNSSYQQVEMTVNFNSLRVTAPAEQLYTEVMQNGREDCRSVNPRPTAVRYDALQWQHCRELIFQAGNEYHKFEMLDLSHPTMGVDRIVWDGSAYHVFPFLAAPRRNYLYDEDADGAFLIRNSDNEETDNTCDYAWVHYKLVPADNYAPADVFVDGAWTTEHGSVYRMDYDPADRSYNAVVMQKQGYYNYQFVRRVPDGRSQLVPEEGSFFETENRYQAFVYYKGPTERAWRLVGFQQVVIR